ncbi:hypothetical protein GIB67_041956 [Kingdonia uniflora]|uniref:No apical meristem-associated C-terminal domain-containing protein n=1 Tax=Kingdonia uniflora TaxID=39325 RepID=A0A7J7NZV9_9MAGN|nr:hypothetical protein GIB67_041956 [Kingdonia uniflora]
MPIRLHLPIRCTNGLKRKKFKLDHCWEQLKHHKKWELEVEKKKRKTKVSPNGSNPCIPATQIINDEVTENNGFIDEKKKDWDRRFLSEQFKEDERIMLTNTDGMDEMIKGFYKTKKDEILARNRDAHESSTTRE